MVINWLQGLTTERSETNHSTLFAAEDTPIVWRRKEKTRCTPKAKSRVSIAL